jgi:hypothetical protein
MRILGILMVVVAPFIFCGGGIMMMAEGPDQNGNIKGAFPQAFLLGIEIVSAALFVGGLYLALRRPAESSEDKSDFGGE